MKEEVRDENDGEHVEAKVKVTKWIFCWRNNLQRENLFLIVANTKYGQAVMVNSRYITWEAIFSLLMFNSLIWKLIDVYLQLQKKFSLFS